MPGSKPYANLRLGQALHLSVQAEQGPDQDFGALRPMDCLCAAHEAERDCVKVQNSSLPGERRLVSPEEHT